ncbi:MAG: hypothetical protein BMS9Abin02_1813 [Anaerolineae bacterium]|nr:MAG: hypothetical protein BMS9Abin02_1813 [Anaerolineae bacterium]
MVIITKVILLRSSALAIAGKMVLAIIKPSQMPSIEKPSLEVSGAW